MDRVSPVLAYSIAEWVEVSNIGRTKTYDEIKRGRLKARKVGRQTIITDPDGREYLQSRPTTKAD
jgi:hypothetical protein